MAYKSNPVTGDNSVQETGSTDLFWGENYPKLKQYCHFLAQNSWDGDDIAQEAYLKTLKYIAKQQKVTPALLNKVAYHHWIDMVRKRKYEILENEFETIMPDESERSVEIAQSVDLLLEKFTPKQAVIYMLKEAFQFQVNEIADVLETTESAVKASLHRAKKRLQNGEINGDSFSVVSFWEEDEQQRFSALFYQALKNGDPTVLIRAITLPVKDAQEPILMTKTHQTHLSYSPYCTLCMAA